MSALISPQVIEQLTAQIGQDRVNALRSEALEKRIPLLTLIGQICNNHTDAVQAIQTSKQKASA